MGAEHRAHEQELKGAEIELDDQEDAEQHGHQVMREPLAGRVDEVGGLRAKPCHGEAAYARSRVTGPSSDGYGDVGASQA